jgi:hypothetical protein
MKKQILMSLILISLILTVNAQWSATDPVYTNSNVGIGITSPEAKLHVSGTVSANMLGISSITLPTSGDELGVFTIKTDHNSTMWGESIVSYGITGKGLRVYNSGGPGCTAFEVAQGTGSRLIVDGNGNVGIGTSTPDSRYKLDVAGTIRACEVKVNLESGMCPDFVFKSDYKLMDLKELEKFVKTNQHLPKIAPEKEMVENGLNMKEFQMKLLQKIEELTLYTIEQNKKIEALEEKIAKTETASK